MGPAKRQGHPPVAQVRVMQMAWAFAQHASLRTADLLKPRADPARPGPRPRFLASALSSGGALTGRLSRTTSNTEGKRDLIFLAYTCSFQVPLIYWE